MDAAPPRTAARRAARSLAGFAVGIALTLVAACQQPTPLEPLIRETGRHPIQAAPPAAVPGARPVTEPGAAPGITPGPNSRITRTPDMAPRVEPLSRPGIPASPPDLEQFRLELEEQRRKYKREEPGPPAGTIDLRPGTIRLKPGTIEVPR